MSDERGEAAPASPGVLARTTTFFQHEVAAILPSWEAYREVRGAYKDSRINALLIVVPLAALSPLLGLSPTVVFLLNFVALVPLAPLLWLSISQVSPLAGIYAGGILRTTCQNAVEMIVRGAFSL